MSAETDDRLRHDMNLWPVSLNAERTNRRRFTPSSARYYLAAASCDDLRAEFERVKKKHPDLLKFHDKLVRAFRAASRSAPTRAIADTPTHFHVENFPTRRFLLIPKVSSERRPFIPIGFMKPDVIVSDLVFVVPNATLIHFGVLSSTMHMAWVRQVCGRLKSRYRYSNKLVYNNYPWPTDATDAQKQAVETAAQGVLDARAAFPAQTLADLYDPLAMPKELRDAHPALDRAFDRCYRPQPFDSDRHRVEYLFALYEKLTTLFAPAMGARRSRPRECDGQRGVRGVVRFHDASVFPAGYAFPRFRYGSNRSPAVTFSA